MWLSVILIVCAIAIFVFAFVGVFGRFPDNWEWVGIVLAGWGIAMATPSVMQMVMGRPHLLVESYEYVQDDQKTLQVLLKNPPVRNPIWRLLGVRRDTLQSLTASYRIAERGSGTIVVPIRQARIYSDDDPADEGKNRIALPPTFSIAASILIAIWQPEKQKVFVPGERQKQPVELSNGLYKATIIFSVEGENKYVTGEFVVGDKRDELVWAKPVQSTPCKVRSQP